MGASGSSESQQLVTEASPAAESFLRRAFQTRSDFSGSVTTVCTSSQNRGKGLAGGEQGFGKGLADVGIEQGGEQPFEGMVVEEDGHGRTG